MSRYETVYFGAFFTGDKETWWNSYEARDYNDAWDMYVAVKNTGMRAYIKDNDEDVCFEDGEWY